MFSEYIMWDIMCIVSRAERENYANLQQKFFKILRFLVDNPKCSVSGFVGPDPRQIFIFKLKLTNLLPEKMWVRDR